MNGLEFLIRELVVLLRCIQVTWDLIYTPELQKPRFYPSKWGKLLSSEPCCGLVYRKLIKCHGTVTLHTGKGMQQCDLKIHEERKMCYVSLAFSSFSTMRIK